MVSPASLRIPVPEMMFPGTQWTTNTSHSTATGSLTTYTVMPTCHRSRTTSTAVRPCPRDSRRPLDSVLRTGTLVRATSSSLHAPARATSASLHAPVRAASSSTDSGLSRLPLDSFLHSPARATSNSLPTPARTTSTDSGSKSSRLPRDSFLHTPARSTSTSTDSGVLETRTDMMLSASTLTELLSPLEALRWPLSPPAMGSEILSPMSPAQSFFPREERCPTTGLSTSTSTGKTATATASRTLKVARWVSEFEADKKQAGDECSSISLTEVGTNTTNETDEIETATKETEVEETNETTVEINESGTASVQRRNPPTHNRQAGSNSVESVVMAGEEKRVTVDLETEDKETTNADSSREEELTTGDCQVSKSNQTKEVNQSELVMKPQTELGEYVESEPEGEIKSEEDESEYQEGPIAETTEVKDISLTEEIKIEKEDEDLELKLEVGDTRFQRQEIIAWPRITDSNECNNDDEDTLPWSPLPDLTNEETSSGNDTTSTVPCVIRDWCILYKREHVPTTGFF